MIVPHYSEDHVSLLLEISKVYKIMSLLQPDTDDGLLSSSNQSLQQSTSPSVFPKLRWECLQHRLQTLDPISSTKHPGVIHELSNVCSQLFDLQYKSLAMLRRNKVAISEANIKQLNFFGNKFLKYTQ